jgi:hypothetical protein
MRDAAAKAMMEEVARMYEDMAAIAARREGGKGA